MTAFKTNAGISRLSLSFWLRHRYTQAGSTGETRPIQRGDCKQTLPLQMASFDAIWEGCLDDHNHKGKEDTRQGLSASRKFLLKASVNEHEQKLHFIQLRRVQPLRQRHPSTHGIRWRRRPMQTFRLEGGTMKRCSTGNRCQVTV